MSHIMRKPTICIYENKDAFVFASRIEQNLKFQASSLFLSVYSLVCVRPGNHFVMADITAFPLSTDKHLFIGHHKFVTKIYEHFIPNGIII